MTNPSDPCPWCGAAALERHRPRTVPELDVLACIDCGEFWVEGEGRPLTPETLRGLGLLS